MGHSGAVIGCLLLAVGASWAQKVQTERLLPQWLTGIIAVSCFLLLTFIGFLVKKIWCDKPSSRKRSSEASEGRSDIITENPYDHNLDDLRRTNDVELLDRGTVQENIYDHSLDDLRGKGGAERETDNNATYETTLDVLRSRDNRNAFNNLMVAPSEDRVTAM